jgi:hypothetical protein
VSKKPFISQVFTPSAPPRYSRISPQAWLKPIAGHRSVIVENMRKIATIARNCGNIWISSRASSPTRRPWNRNRLKAYAASADRNTDVTAATPAISTELPNHRAKPVSCSRLPKLAGEAPVGTAVVDDSVPSGFSAADSTNTIGKSEKISASSATPCRQPTRVSHFVMSRPLPGGGCCGS